MKQSDFCGNMKVLLLLAIFVFSAEYINAQLPRGYSDNFYKGMRYGLFKPADYNPQHKYPLILYLHGSTDTTSWNFNWYNPPVSTDDPCFVLTPKTLVRGGGWGTNHSKTNSVDMQNALEIMDSLIRIYNIDTNRLYINGSSMGGYGTFSAISKEPGRFAAAYSICGGGTANEAENMKLTPLWIFHGSADPVVNVSNSRDIYKRILEVGGKEVRYTEYPGVGHNSWENAGKEKTLTKWMLKQVKGVKHGAPAQVEGLKVVSSANGKVELVWKPASFISNPDNEIWYYKIFRDGSPVKEIDGDVTTFADSIGNITNPVKYHLVGVNYFFKETGPSKEVVVKKMK
jgi:dienelactone hydrolase